MDFRREELEENSEAAHMRGLFPGARRERSTAKCTQCGASLPADAVYCSSCGKAVSTGAETSLPGGGPGLSLPGIGYNVAALLCYILWPFACIFFLLVGPYNQNRFVRFHAFQAAFLGVAGIMAAFALLIVSSILSLIPLLGWLISSLAWMVYGTGLLVLAIALMYKAYNGERYCLPVIGDMAIRQADNQP